jgi:hypothetical protein
MGGSCVILTDSEKELKKDAIYSKGNCLTIFQVKKRTFRKLATINPISLLHA